MTVLDFVGQAHNNYDFSFKLRTLIGKTRHGIKEEIDDNFPNMPAGCHIKLEKIAKEHILNNIQSSIFTVTDLRKMVKDFNINFSNLLNLENFLENYGIDIDRFYSRYSFYELLYQAGFRKKYQAEDKKSLKQSLRRFSKIDSKRLLDFSEKILKKDLEMSSLTKAERLMLGMFHYTLWGERPESTYEKSLKDLKYKNIDIVEELLEIIDYNRKRIKAIEIEYEDREIPLDIYASYSVQQIMVAFEKTREDYEYPMREGVLYVEDKHTDLFFITINKNEEDYLPSTMYNDYAKNSQLFNWESQSKTSVESPTGRRYINDRTAEYKVLLFVRQSKQEYGHAPPYIFLGKARYQSHSGNRPIEIVWKMDYSIPEKIIRESNLRVVN